VRCGVSCILKQPGIPACVKQDCAHNEQRNQKAEQQTDPVDVPSFYIPQPTVQVAVPDHADTPAALSASILRKQPCLMQPYLLRS
jgi:hypothetical protein